MKQHTAQRRPKLFRQSQTPKLLQNLIFNLGTLEGNLKLIQATCEHMLNCEYKRKDFQDEVDSAVSYCEELKEVLTDMRMGSKNTNKYKKAQEYRQALAESLTHIPKELLSHLTVYKHSQVKGYEAFNRFFLDFKKVIKG